MSSMPNGRKPGRPQAPELVVARNMFPDASERTRARWARAARLFDKALIDRADKAQAMQACTRPNGSFNFAKFERIAEAAAIDKAIQDMEEQQ